MVCSTYKGHRCLDNESHKVFVSQHVQSNEQFFPYPLSSSLSSQNFSPAYFSDSASSLSYSSRVCPQHFTSGHFPAAVSHSNSQSTAALESSSAASPSTDPSPCISASPSATASLAASSCHSTSAASSCPPAGSLDYSPAAGSSTAAHSSSATSSCNTSSAAGDCHSSSAAGASSCHSSSAASSCSAARSFDSTPAADSSTAANSLSAASSCNTSSAAGDCHSSSAAGAPAAQSSTTAASPSISGVTPLPIVHSNAYPMLTRSKTCSLPKPLNTLATVSGSSSIVEPKTFKEASKIQAWLDALQEEYSALISQHTWDLVPFPFGKQSIGSKWIYKVKTHVDALVGIRLALLLRASSGAWRRLSRDL